MKYTIQLLGYAHLWKPPYDPIWGVRGKMTFLRGFFKYVFIMCRSWKIPIQHMNHQNLCDLMWILSFATRVKRINIFRCGWLPASLLISCNRTTPWRKGKAKAKAKGKAAAPVEEEAHRRCSWVKPWFLVGSSESNLRRRFPGGCFSKNWTQKKV